MTKKGVSMSPDVEPTIDVPLTLADLRITKQALNTIQNTWLRNPNPSSRQEHDQSMLARVELKVTGAIADLLADEPWGGSDVQ